MEETRQYSAVNEFSDHRKRLRGFAWHLVGYVVLMAPLVAFNLIAMPDRPWFVLPLVGWGAPLALHAAFAMGLFDAFRRG
jgi:2TM domain